MTMEERGQYITLLCYQHQRGHIKEETIRLLVGLPSVNVLNHFKHHVRMRETLKAIYSQMTDQERARAEVERRHKEVHGETNSKDWLMQLDLLISQSFRRRTGTYPFLRRSFCLPAATS